MSDTIKKSINGLDEITSFTWDKNVIVQDGSGAESGTIGSGAKLRRMSLAELKDRLALKTQVDEILQGQDLDPNKDVEVLGARTSGYDGTTHDTIGNRMDAIEKSIVDSGAKRYGLRWYTDDDTYVRTGSAYGLTFRRHAGSYTEGLYSDFTFEAPWAGIKACKMDVDGNVVAWYGDPGYDEADGEDMVYIPRVFTGMRVEIVDDRPSILLECSTGQLPGLYPTGFVRPDGTLMQGVYIGRTALGSDMVTKRGVTPKTAKSMQSFMADLFAKSTTASWRMADMGIWQAIMTLMVIEIGGFDTQTLIGTGISSGMPYGSGTEYQIVTASTDANTVTLATTVTSFRVGMVVQVGTAYSNNSIAANRTITAIVDNGDGTQTLTVDGDAFSTAVGNTCVTWGQPVPPDQMDALNGESGYILQFDAQNRSHVCYRGIWDLWGNVWQYLGGIIRLEGKFYACFNRDKHNLFSSAAIQADDDWFDTDYQPIVENGFQKEREILSYSKGQLFPPKTTGGGASSTTYLAAYLYSFGASYQTSTRVVLFGGWYSGGNCSLLCWNGDYSPSYTWVYNGARSLIESSA